MYIKNMNNNNNNIVNTIILIILSALLYPHGSDHVVTMAVDEHVQSGVLREELGVPVK